MIYYNIDKFLLIKISLNKNIFKHYSRIRFWMKKLLGVKNTNEEDVK